MEINISTDEVKIFKQYLHIVNGLLPKEKKLTSIEIDVLDKLLYIDYKYKHLSKEKRDLILFNRETSNRICQAVYNMSISSYNNIITKLRKKGYINKRSLKAFVPLKDNKIQLTFKLEIK